MLPPVLPSMPPLTFAGATAAEETERPENDKGPGSTPGALVTTVLDLRSRQRLTRRPGGPAPGAVDGGVTVWIPLQRSSSG